MKRNILWILIASALATGCFNEGALVNNPAPLLHYQHQPTEARLLQLAKTYAETINHNLKEDVIHPGQYADYGIALALLGCTEQANTMFNNEKAFFPNSSKYVDFLKKAYTPAMAGNNHFDTSKIDLKTLDTIHVTLTPEEQAVQSQLEADPEYQKMLKQQMKEEKEARAQATKKAKKEIAKAKEKERKAQAKEKERAQKAKAEAKEAERKAKADAKKAEEKARKEAARAAKKAAKNNAKSNNDDQPQPTQA